MKKPVVKSKGRLAMERNWRMRQRRTQMYALLKEMIPAPDTFRVPADMSERVRKLLGEIDNGT